MSDAIEKAIEKIKAFYKQEIEFTEEERDTKLGKLLGIAKSKLSKSKHLLDIKLKVQTKKFLLKRDYDVARNALLMKEEIQKGKNAEVRNAMVELELAGSQFDKIGEYDLLLMVISGVEHHNANILDMFFRGEK